MKLNDNRCALGSRLEGPPSTVNTVNLIAVMQHKQLSREAVSK